jgi:hypothetical protein
VSNLAENGFSMEARVGIEAVSSFQAEHKQFEGKARNEKPAVQSWQ